MRGRLAQSAFVAALMIGGTGCHTLGGDALRPAVLVRDAPEAREAITKAAQAATREGRVSFGTSDLSKDPVISVQPRPAPSEGNSMAMPTFFDLVTDGKACFLREQKTGKTHPLPGVACRPK